jgi:hypothetical protein
MSRQRRKERPPPPDVPIFSERLATILEKLFEGKTPNAGNFCGFCFTPLDKNRLHCPHCQHAVADYPGVSRVPAEVLQMFRSQRRRESLVVNGFAYLGLALGVTIFIGVFYILFSVNANVWWYVFDIFLLFVAARALAGLLGGWIGDEVGFRYARNKLHEEWQAFDAARDAQRAERTAAKATLSS